MTDKLALADEIERLEDVTCPLCGDTGFDAAGFVGHMMRWCEVANIVTNVPHPQPNAAVAAALRAGATDANG